MSSLDPREELASIASSLRAYLEWQFECGSSGIPRLPRGARGPSAASATEPRATATEPRATATEPHAGNVHGEQFATKALSRSSDDPLHADGAAPSTRLPAPAPAEKTSLPAITFPESVDARPTAATSRRTDERARAATTVSDAPRPLPVIQEEVASCMKCGLGSTRTNTVFSRGNPEAKLCFVGEAPGADEDAQGIPFVGRAGQLLDRMIVAMGLDPEKDVYICNIIKCRPPGNRRPEPDETSACIPYLHEQLAQVEPRVIVALGNTAVASLVGTKIGITKVRGSWKLYRAKIPVMPTYHPSYLLRSSPQQGEAKRQAWEDLQAVMQELGLPKPARS